MWWITVILMIFAGIFNACMDVLKTRYVISIFRFWKNSQWINPAFSWKNKWKNGDIIQGEKFFGSTTFLVWLTDFWHLCKILMLLTISFAIVLYNPIIVWYIDFLILYMCFTIPFEIFYSIVLIKT